MSVRFYSSRGLDPVHLSFYVSTETVATSFKVLL